MYRSDNTTGAYRLKIANIDKLYIFNMQLFMFLYMGIFFDTTLRGLLHCYIVTLLRLRFLKPMKKGWKNGQRIVYINIHIYIYYSLSPSGVHFCKCNNVTMVGLDCQGEGWLVRKLVDRGVCVVSAIYLKIFPAAMRHAWQQSKPNSEWQQSLCQRDEWLLHCYVCVFPLHLQFSQMRFICKGYSER